MRELISGSFFSHNQRMKEAFIKSRIVRGGSSKIEQCMRTAGWEPLNPSAAVAVYISEKTGTINAAKLVLVGSLEKFSIDAATLFFALLNSWVKCKSYQIFLNNSIFHQKFI